MLANAVTAKNESGFAEETILTMCKRTQLVNHIISDEVCEDTYVPLLVLLYNSIVRVKQS